MMLRKIISITPLLASILIMTLSYILMYLIIYTLFTFSSSKREYFRGLFSSTWFWLVKKYIYYLCPSEFEVVKKDFTLDEKKNIIVIANHQLLSDWIHIQNILTLLGRERELCIIYKSSLLDIPILGDMLLLFEYIPLLRNWTEGKREFLKELEKIKEREKLSLLLFPEGTIITNNSIPSGRLYTEAQGISPFENVLPPKYIGLYVILQLFDKKIDGILDLTIDYGVSSTYLDAEIGAIPHLTSGKGPKDIKVYMDYYKAEEIPGNSQNLETSKKQNDDFNPPEEYREWLLNVFRRKDQLLKDSKERTGTPRYTSYIRKNESPSFLMLGCIVLCPLLLFVFTSKFIRDY
eukprot:GHVP01054060.1.p1 GENE.GHVP01054060.1~~GHVP01054060.1.p1  ORF type:complete len:349 (+),score=49.96 GHVP01054060.1:135-1181(+)